MTSYPYYFMLYPNLEAFPGVNASSNHYLMESLFAQAKVNGLNSIVVCVILWLLL